MEKDTEDSWKRKSIGRLCQTCLYYVPKQVGTIGRCRRHSPTLAGWPVMFPNDWCGDHKLEAD